MFATRFRECGTVIDEFATLAEAEAAVKEYEAIDEKDGNYSPGFYEIYDMDKEEIVL